METIKGHFPQKDIHLPVGKDPREQQIFSLARKLNLNKVPTAVALQVGVGYIVAKEDKRL